MVKEYLVRIDDEQICSIIASDEEKALLAARAAGRAIIEVYKTYDGKKIISKYGVDYFDDITPQYLERVARRFMKLPWNIIETTRLLIRELTLEDMIVLNRCTTLQDRILLGKDEEIFHNKGKLGAYIDRQYGFFEFGIWGIVDKESDQLIGKAGLDYSDHEYDSVEISYLIFEEYRRQGYAYEACRAILTYAHDELLIDEIVARIDKYNMESRALANKLGIPII